MAITQEIIDRVKAANPGVEIDLLEHDTLPDQVLARVPQRSIYSIYLQKLADPATRMEGREMLVSSCVLYPDAAGLTAMVEAHPALIGVWCDELVEMAGATLKARRKKV